jgi:hypothetical protein
MRIFYAVLLLLVASVVADGQSSEPNQNGDDHPPFTLTISASPTNPALEDLADQGVKVGATVMLRIRKTNVSDREIVKWPATGGPFGDSFEVRDGSGNLVEHRKSNKVGTSGGGEGRLKGTKDVVLQPGESKVDLAPISDWYDMSTPGTYTVQVSGHITDDPKSDVVKSNIIKITVLPADGPPPTQQ